MQQNHRRKQLRSIKVEIDSSIDHIDCLLRKLNKKKGKQTNILGSIDNLDRRSSAKENQRDSDKKLTIVNELVQLKENYEVTYYERSAEKPVSDCLQQNHSIEQSVMFLAYKAKQCNLDQPLSVKCCTRSNWITKYLDEGDCEIFLSNDNVLEIIGVENGLLTCLDQQNTYHALETTEIYDYDQLDVTFNKHLEGLQLDFSTQGNKIIYELNIQERCRFIAKADEQNEDMKHIVLLKDSSASEKQKYQLYWGNYFQSEMIEDNIIEEGRYYLLSLGDKAIKNFQLFFQHREVVQIRAGTESPFIAKEMLTLSFSECLTSKDGFYSDRTVGQEYARSVYIDIGLVIEIYQNIYPFEAKFIDEEPIKEDLQLLFSQLYTKQQKQNRLKRGERVIKFYGVQAKPASLFVPRKQVIMGNEIMQNKISHSVFK